jgi:hypothetical protein
MAVVFDVEVLAALEAHLGVRKARDFVELLWHDEAMWWLGHEWERLRANEPSLPAWDVESVRALFPIGLVRVGIGTRTWRLGSTRRKRSGDPRASRGSTRVGRTSRTGRSGGRAGSQYSLAHPPACWIGYARTCADDSGQQ